MRQVGKVMLQVLESLWVKKERTEIGKVILSISMGKQKQILLLVTIPFIEYSW